MTGNDWRTNVGDELDRIEADLQRRMDPAFNPDNDYRFPCCRRCGQHGPCDCGDLEDIVRGGEGRGVGSILFSAFVAFVCGAALLGVFTMGYAVWSAMR